MKKNNLMRVDDDFRVKLRKIIPERLQNFPEDYGELSDREMTRMMTNAPSFSNLLKELKNLPRRKNE